MDGLNPDPLFLRDTCMDAGGRTKHGALAERVVERERRLNSQ